MVRISWKEKYNYTYSGENEFEGQITGYDIREQSATVKEVDVDDFLVGLAENENVFEVRVDWPFSEQKKESGEYLIDPGYWEEPY